MLQGKKVGKFFEPLLPIDLSKHGVKQKMIVTTGLQGTLAVNSFPFNAITLTDVETVDEALAKVYDDSDDFYNLKAAGGAGGYAANYQLFPGTEAEDDAAYFGYGSKFCVIYFNVSATVATYGADAAKWQYFDGSAWQDLTIIYDGTDDTANDGLRPFQVDGYLIFSPPSDWKKTSVDGKNAYWIRSVLTAAQVTQAPVLDSSYHQTVSFSYPFKAPVDGKVTRIRFTWGTNSDANNDSKLVLVNVTKQTVSAEKTHTKAKQSFSIDDFDLEVEEGDELVLFATAEDGATEFADGKAEITFN